MQDWILVEALVQMHPHACSVGKEMVLGVQLEQEKEVSCERVIVEMEVATGVLVIAEKDMLVVKQMRLTDLFELELTSSKYWTGREWSDRKSQDSDLVLCVCSQRRAGADVRNIPAAGDCADRSTAVVFDEGQYYY